MVEGQRREHPIVAGVLALVGVAVVVGLILGGVALAAAKVTGLDNGSASDAAATHDETLYIPSTSATDINSQGTFVSLPPDTTSPSTSLAAPSTSVSAPSGITLTVGESSVGEMQPINLSGTYPGGQGEILEVQQFTAGAWSDFYSVSVNVVGDSFETFVQTGVTGKHRFRVFDTDAGTASNPITVTVR